MLRPGAHGASVTMLQRQLLDLGYWLPSADGEYGPLTAEAVHTILSNLVRNAMAAVAEAGGRTGDGRVLVRLEEEKREAQQAAKYEGQAKTGFGSQIRSYFQHPDQRVKDERTGYKMTNFQQVLDGRIHGFLDAYLRWRVGAEAPAE